MRLPQIILSGLLLGLLAWGCAAKQDKPVAVPGTTTLSASAARGHTVYLKACASCHGVEGDGKGRAAQGLDPEPRDFVRAVYRYRSTPTGSLPRDRDLARVVLVGAPHTEMPAWRDHLSGQEVADVVAYVKSFSTRFGEEEIDDAITAPKPIPYSAASVARGKQVYDKAQCGKCHGKEGRGDGWAKDDEMKDPLGRVVPARDFTRGIYRSGSTKESLYTVFYTGLDGTPMPGYEESMKPKEIYDLVNYLLSLERSRGVLYWLSTPPRWYEPSRQRVER